MREKLRQYHHFNLELLAEVEEIEKDECRLLLFTIVGETSCSTLS